MDKLELVTQQLSKLRKTGEGKYLACCPAHDDKNPSLSIKETGDSKILLHCFAGCEVNEIVSALGLTLVDLMPKNPDFKKGIKPPKFNKYELFDRLSFESTILLVAIRQLFNGQPLNNDDMARVRKAEITIDEIAKEVRR
ncbi:MAG: CHC2 zinc finger domain-containing protein [Methylococcaceae bacterium]